MEYDRLRERDSENNEMVVGKRSSGVTMMTMRAWLHMARLDHISKCILEVRSQVFYLMEKEVTNKKGETIIKCLVLLFDWN